jgi:cysteine synthase A
VQLARQLGPGNTIVTILCDGGHKYVSRFWNRDYLAQKGLAEHAATVSGIGAA